MVQVKNDKIDNLQKSSALIGDAVGNISKGIRDFRQKKKQREFLKSQGADSYGFDLLSDPETGIKELASQKFQDARSTRNRAQSLEDESRKRTQDLEDYKTKEQFKKDLDLGVFQYEEELKQANKVALSNHNHKLQLDRQGQQLSGSMANQKSLAAYKAQLANTQQNVSQSRGALTALVQKSKLDPGAKATLIKEIGDTGGLSDVSIKRLAASKRITAPKPGVDSTSGDEELDGKIDSIIYGGN